MSVMQMSTIVALQATLVITIVTIITAAIMAAAALSKYHQ